MEYLSPPLVCLSDVYGSYAYRDTNALKARLSIFPSAINHNPTPPPPPHEVLPNALPAPRPSDNNTLICSSRRARFIQCRAWYSRLQALRDHRQTLWRV